MIFATVAYILNKSSKPFFSVKLHSHSLSFPPLPRLMLICVNRWIVWRHVSTVNAFPFKGSDVHLSREPHHVDHTLTCTF